MKKIAVLFPGQGSQYVGMGKAFYDQDPDFRAGFDRMGEKLGVDIHRLCFAETELQNETEYLQIAITTVSSLIFDSVSKLLKGAEIAFIGHSLGEFSALYAAGVFDHNTLTDLVCYRGEVMAEAARNHPGKMAAVIGGEKDKLESVCEALRQVGYVVQVANYNLPNQIVISGTSDAIDQFAQRQAEVGFRRLVYLKVSGAFHSELMQTAADKFLERLKARKKQAPKYPVVMNATAKELEFDRIDEVLAKQLISPVRFTESIQLMLDRGIDTFVEIGPGTVLQNLVRKIAPDATIMSINTPEDINQLEEIL